MLLKNIQVSKTANMSNIWKILYLMGTMSLGTLHAQNQTTMTYEAYIRSGAPSEREIDVFLNERSWAQFDAELGYVLGNYTPNDGIEGSSTISTSQDNGTRTSFIYRDKPARINTYGNSFTQCHQVSDAETWQEYLAGHLGEPIRNYGMGGYGVYQSYRRMLREEASENSAEYLIFYIWGGDHIRSLFRCRYLAFREWTAQNAQTEGEGIMFHGNFWPNLEMDLETGEFLENDSRIQSEEALINMTDPDWLWENVKDDYALQMFLYQEGKINNVDLNALKKISQHLGVTTDWNHNPSKEAVSALLDQYSLAASKYIVQKARSFAETNGKKLLVALFDPYRVLRALLQGQERYESDFVEFLEEDGYNYFDMNLVHVADFEQFNLDVDGYFDRYFIGHYNPTGNHFFAYKIKDAVIQMLDPKPFTYGAKNTRAINFEGYLNKY